MPDPNRIQRGAASLTAIAMLVLAPGQLPADSDGELSRSELVDAWASILYCQSIYEEPSVRGRVYKGDRDDCNAAQEHLSATAEDRGPGAEIEHIARDAAQKAAAIRYNTLSLDDAVTACRRQ